MYYEVHCISHGSFQASHTEGKYGWTLSQEDQSHLELLIKMSNTKQLDTVITVEDFSLGLTEPLNIKH
jgi:hypothetical protein